MPQRVLKEKGDFCFIAPDYPEPLEYVDDFDTEEEANEEAWAWRQLGYYATRKRYTNKWRLFIGEGRERPAPEPKDPTRSAYEQRG